MADLSQSPSVVWTSWQRLDKVILVTGLGIAALAILDSAALEPVIADMLNSFLGTLPFIMLAVLSLGWMKASGSERLLEGAFNGAELPMIAVGALAGGLSPFCSCEVIPFIAALLAAGAPLGAVMAFWLASPLMDPAMFFVTWGGLGVEFAAAKVVAAITLGLIGGLAVKALSARGALADPLRTETSVGGCCGAKKLSLNWAFWQEQDRRAVFARTAGSNLLFLGKWLLLAYFLQGLLIRYVPADLIASVIGGDGAGPILLAASVGAPAYLNGYAAVPLLEGLLAQGMSDGAAMAFMIAGGVSSIPAAVAVWALVKPRVFMIYLVLGSLGAVLAGLSWGAAAAWLA